MLAAAAGHWPLVHALGMVCELQASEQTAHMMKS